ncbi:MAG: GAF domain-containing protein, partial [Eubacterium sp.]
KVFQSDGDTTLDETKSFRQNRIEYVFKILYQSENSKTAIRSVLELVSSHFAFERGYIFETSKDGKTTSNTFEWCAEGVKAHIDNLQNVPIDIVATAHTHFHKTGTFILRTLDDLRPEEREVLEPQDIKSMFQFGIFDHNNLLGFIGFDNCEEESVPSDADIDEITTICNILATFFVKQRISDESAKNLNSMVEVMNHLENYIYVINTETFEVLFMNERIGMLMEKEDVSPYCYSFFRGNDSQCPDCPVRKLMDEKRERSTAKIYNKKLGIWIETTASILRWMDGETACLVNCLDISKQYQMRQ